jgi:hypothetical protein
MNFFIIFPLKNFSNRFIIVLFVPEIGKQILKINTMNTLLKSLGIIILLIGVGVLAIPAFTDMRNNTVLAVGLGAILLGFIAHIFLNKKFE